MISRTLGLAVVLALAIACGDKSNTVGRGDNLTPINNDPLNPGDAYTNLPGFSAEMNAQIQQIKGSTQCRQPNGSPSQRLTQDFTFRTRGFNPQGTRTNIYGPFEPGNVGGTPTSLYVGLSTFGDIMIVSKVTNGSQVVGYNVTLSLCSYSGQDGTPYIDNRRPVESFSASQGGITLDQDSHCGIGSVDAAIDTRTVMAAMTAQNNMGMSIQLPPFVAVTSFYKAQCNNMY
jgi:hypothetical protein